MMCDPSFSLEELKKLLKQEQYGKLISTVFSSTTPCSNWPCGVEECMLIALDNLSFELLSKDHKLQAKWLWNKAIEITNHTIPALALHYSKFLIRCNEVLDSFEILDDFICKNPLYIPSYECLENIKSLIVDRWHFRMLNDNFRNTSYFNAIQTVLNKRKSNLVVLDIGGGTGLLSIYAAKAGAHHVYCCEASLPLAEMARRCIESHGLRDKITIICKHSSTVQLGSDIPQPVDLIVTELVDSGLLGEKIIPVLQDARSRLLAKDGEVIPHSADVFGVLVDSNRLRSRQHAGNTSSTYLPRESGFVSYIVDEKYTCEDLHMFPNTALSATQPIYSLNFLPTSHPVDAGTSPVQPGGSLDHRSYGEVTREFLVSSAGFIDGVAYWFQLHLLPPTYDDFLHPSEGTVEHPGVRISVSTAPGRDSCGWDQAIMFSSSIPTRYFRPERNAWLRIKDRSRFSVVEGDRIRLHVEVNRCCDGLNMSLDISPSLHLPQGESPYGAHAETDFVGETLYSPVEDRLEVAIGEMDMSELNNKSYRNFIAKSLRSAVIQLLECRRRSGRVSCAGRLVQQSVRILEMGCSWSSAVLSFIIDVARLGPDSENELGQNTSIEALILCQCEEQYNALNLICMQHGLQGNVSIHFGSLIEYAQSDPDALRRGFDLMVSDVVEGCGLIRQQALEEYCFASQFLLTSESNIDGVVSNREDDDSGGLAGVPRCLPCSICVIVSAIQCPSLLTHHKVHPKATGEEYIHKHINHYGARLLRELDLAHTSDLQLLSSPTPSATVSLPQLASPAYSSSASQQDVPLEIIRGGTMHAVCIWYNIGYSYADVGAFVGTGPGIGDTSNGFQDSTDSHWRQAAFLLEDGGSVEEGDVVLVDLRLDLSVGFWCFIKEHRKTSLELSTFCNK